MGFSRKEHTMVFKKKEVKKEDLFCVILKVPMLPGFLTMAVKAFAVIQS